MQREPAATDPSAALTVVSIAIPAARPELASTGPGSGIYGLNGCLSILSSHLSIPLTALRRPGIAKLSLKVAVPGEQIVLFSATTRQ